MLINTRAKGRHEHQKRKVMRERKYIQSIQRSSIILQYIADKGKAKLNEICKATGLKTSTAFGILQTLEHVEQVTRINNGLEYTLGLNSVKLGLSYLNGSGINDTIHELLTKLVDIVGETAYFELKVGDRYYYLDYVVSSHPLKVVVEPEEGRFIEFTEHSAIAQAFNHPEEGFRYAADIEGVYEGMNCLAVPYRTGGAVVGCLVITGLSFRFTEEKMDEAFIAYTDVMKSLGLESHL